MSEVLTTARLVEPPRDELVTDRDTARRRRQPWLVHALLILGAIIMVFPFFWQVMTSFKDFAQATTVPPVWIPTEWHWENFAKVFEAMPFAQMFGNSVLITVVRTLAQVIFCTMAGYAFARMQFPGRNILFVLFLSVLMIPGQLFLLPQFEIMKTLGLIDTLAAIVLPGLISAFGTFLMRQFFMGLPRDIEEAARIDGANQWQIFWRIMVPLAKPGIIALTVFMVLGAWNEMLWPLIVTTSSENMPLTVGLTTLKGMNVTDYPMLMAGSLLATLPMVLVFMVLQRQFIQGIAFTGSKG